MTTTVATIRKAIGGAVIAAATSAYAVLNANGFDVGHVSSSQWESVAIAGLAAFTTVYHLPYLKTVAQPAASASASAETPDPLTAWADGVVAAPPPVDEVDASI